MDQWIMGKMSPLFEMKLFAVVSYLVENVTICSCEKTQG